MNILLFVISIFIIYDCKQNNLSTYKLFCWVLIVATRRAEKWLLKTVLTDNMMSQSSQFDDNDVNLTNESKS